MVTVVQSNGASKGWETASVAMVPWSTRRAKVRQASGVEERMQELPVEPVHSQNQDTGGKRGRAMHGGIGTVNARPVPPARQYLGPTGSQTHPMPFLMLIEASSAFWPPRRGGRTIAGGSLPPVHVPNGWHPGRVRESWRSQIPFPQTATISAPLRGALLFFLLPGVRNPRLLSCHLSGVSREEKSRPPLQST